MLSPRLAPTLLAALLLGACESPIMEPSAPEAPTAARASASANVFGGAPLLERLNAELGASGHEMRVASMEYITAASSGHLGRTVFANDRGNRRLPGHFVPGDPRRGGAPGIAFLIDSEGSTTSGLSPAQTSDAIRRAMATWEGVTCSTLPLVDLGDAPLDLGLLQFVLGFGGSPFVFADVTHAGWLPGAFFDLIEPGGSTFILGATFTLVFENPPRDDNGDGRFDVAAREIYYNDAFAWNVDGAHIDVESIALHEAGHGLSQGHFGEIFGTNANGKLHFAPLAVMNAAYSRVQRELKGTDNGGHCGIWASWPRD